MLIMAQFLPIVAIQVLKISIYKNNFKNMNKMLFFLQAILVIQVIPLLMEGTIKIIII